MTPATKIPIQDWMSDPATQAVRAPFVDSDSAGPAILFVGGCVRDALLGRPVVDVDMATVHAPEEVMRRLDAAGVGYHTTGVEHGTVAAHMDNRVFEITTLRVDVETDGRHARVAYTDDWAIDASRRDFTINALYADADGNVFDPLGGMADIEARRVRFIGDPNERIQEDALRILRFYRFNAQLDETGLDPDGLAACQAHAGMLERLSGERIRDELFKLLRAPGVFWMLRHEAYPALLKWLFPELPSLKDSYGLEAVAIAERSCGDMDPLRRIAALIEAFPLRNDDDVSVFRANAMAIAARLRLSGVQSKRLARMLDRPRDLEPRWDVEAEMDWDHASAILPLGRIFSLRRRLAREKEIDRSYRAQLYALDSASWRDAVILNWAGQFAHILQAAEYNAPAREIPVQHWIDLLGLPKREPKPEFPLRGADVLDLGVPQGPEISRLLKAVESWWIDGGLNAERDACLEELKRRVGRLPDSGGWV
jgi:poly(A) polymerase